MKTMRCNELSRILSRMRRAQFAALALLFFTAVFAVPIRALADDPPPESRLGGLRELTPDELAAHHARMFVLTPERTTLAPLPAKVVNVTHLPVVRSQGSLGSCSAFAAAYYYKTYQDARRHGWVRPDPETHPQRVASPMWAFNLSQQGTIIDVGYTGPAISPYDAMDLFCTHGSASWADMPYAATNDFHYLPEDTNVWLRAMQRRALQTGRIPEIYTPGGLSLLKRHLADGELAVTGIGGLSGMPMNFIYYPLSTGSNGVHNGVYFRDHGEYSKLGHALTVIGYDDNRSYTDDRTGETRQGALLLVNSWGTGWGVYEPAAESGGFIWVAYDYVLSGGLGDETLIMRNRTDYEPTHVAMVGIDYPSGQGLMHNVFELATRRGRQRIFPGINGTNRVTRVFPVDITDLLAPPVTSLELFAVHVSAHATGTLTDWWVETIDGEVLLTSDAMPVQTQVQKLIRIYLHAVQAETNAMDGFRFRHGSAAFADVNGNGQADLIVTGEEFVSGVTGGVAATALWLNQGDGTFARSAAGLPGTWRGAVAWSDVNNSGAPDLWLGGETDTRLYYNNGAGTFNDSGIRLPPAAAGYLAAADYNRDGRPDLALATTNGVFVYRQNPEGTFSAIRLDERGVPWSFRFNGTPGMLAWGDPDGDGLPDLIVTGVGEDLYIQQPMQTVLYRNRGHDQFEIVASDVPHLAMAAVAWTDFDNDDFDDLAISGTQAAFSSELRGETRLFRGRPDGTLASVDVPTGRLTGLYRGGMHWADFDHSGRRDLLVSGRETHYDPLPPIHDPDYEYSESIYPNRVWIWRNMGQDLFEEAGCELPGVSGVFAPPPLAVADVTGDGSIDLFAAGTLAAPSENKGHRIGGYIARNLSVLFPSHGGTNLPPSAPTGFDAVAIGHGALTFTWSGATDDVTPAAGLRYILRLGTSPGVGDIVSGVIQPYDWGNLVRPGVTYRELPAGTLYWAVQTVDSGGRVSPWSSSQSVTVPAYTPRVMMRFGRQPDYAGTTDPATNVLVPRDSALTVTAHPAPGFFFSHWGGDAPPGTMANPLAWTATNGALLTAHFEPKLNPRTPAWVETPDPEMWGGFSGGIGAGLLAFNNRIYMMGWQRGSTRYNMVLYSESGGGYALGKQWRWADGYIYAPWPARSHHGVEVFNNRMWVIGGQGASDALLNDVWSTSDGINWTQETAAAAWAPRYYGSTAVYDNKLWLFAGRNAAHQRLREVWNSADGRDWTVVTTNAPWHNINRSEVLVFNQQLVLLGGRASAPGEVWSSTDGANWTLLTDRAPWSDRLRAAVYDGRIVVTIGPDATTPDAGQAVWESLDGIAWLQTAPRSDAVHWPVREDQSLAVADGQLWQLGGRRNANHWGYTDVWSYGAQPLSAGSGELWLTATPFDGGMITPPVGVYVDAVGAVMTLSAQPVAGYRFDGWDGPVAQSGALTTTVTLAQSTAVNARFVPDDGGPTDPLVTLSMAVTPTNAGTTAPAVGQHNVWRDYNRTIEAMPAAGYRFSHWSGPVVNPYALKTVVRPTSNTTVTAHFRPQSLAAGLAHTALVRRDGTLWVWGHGNAGQSGRGSGMAVDGLPPLAEWGDVGMVTAGRASTVVTVGGSAMAWGVPWTDGRPASNEWEVVPFDLAVSGQVVRVEAGGDMLMLLVDDGSLWAAGRGDYGQMGRTGWSGATAREPVIVPGLSNLTAVAVSQGHVLGVDLIGRVWGWGGNADGEVDPARSVVIERPVPVPGLPLVRDVAAGGGGLVTVGRSYAIATDGHVWRWGAGLAAPEPVAGLTSIVAIAAGLKHTLALDSLGRVYAWGDNTFGQCGDGTYNDRPAPAMVTGLTAVVEIAAGAYHSAVVSADGQVITWGDDISGAVSGTPGEAVLTPLEIDAMNPLGTTLAIAFCADPDYGGAVIPRRSSYRGRVGGVVPLRTAPEPRYRFLNWLGLVDEIGQPETTLTIQSPVPITALFGLQPDADARLTISLTPAGAGTTTPAAGTHDAPPGTILPVRADHAHRWRFSHWQGAVNDSQTRQTWVALDVDQDVNAVFERLTFRPVPGLSAQYRGLLLLYDDAVVRSATPVTGGSWGNRYATTVMQRDDGLGPLSNMVQVVMRDHRLALSADGTVFAWGLNRDGQCGLGYTSQAVAAPRQVVGPDDAPVLNNIRQVAASGLTSLGLTADGQVMQWGVVSGYAQQFTARPVALLMPDEKPFTDAVAVEAGPLSAVAIRADGSLWRWTSNSLPSVVSGISGARAVSIGGDYTPGHEFTLVALANGTVRAWGDNRYGQLGNGSTNYAATPVTVPGLSGIIAVAAGDYHSLALAANGRVYAWGFNDYGQLGDGTRIDRTTPVQVADLAGIKAIATGFRNGFALADDGRLFCWGAVFGSAPGFTTLTPVADPYLNVGRMDAALTRLTLAIDPDPISGSLFPGIGTYAYNQGDTVELRAVPAEDYRLLRWSDGNTNLWRTVTLNTDLDLTAEFILIEPTIRLDHAWTGPGMGARMRLTMEDGKWPYAGFNAAILLPPGIGLHDVRPGIDLAEGFRLDTVTRRAPGGGTLVSLVAFSPDEAMDARDGEWAVLTLRAGSTAAGGMLPVTWVAGRAWTRCPPAILADTNGIITVRPTLVDGSITVDVANRVHAALRIVAAPTVSGRMSENAFASYYNRTQYLPDEPFVAEIWLRNTGTGAVGIVRASAHLMAYDFNEDDAPLAFGAPEHDAIFHLNTGGAVIGAMVSNFTGTASIGEGRGEWVRLGWATVPAPRDSVAKSFMLAFGDQAPGLTGGLTPDDMAVLGGPITVRTLPELPRAAQGTPHWWLDTYGLVELGVIGYDAAEDTDYRGDGVIARQAYIAGIDPTDVNSRFIVAEIVRGATRDEIAWPGVAGRRYRVYRATTLGPGAIWTLVHGPVDCGTNQVLTFTPTHDGQPRRFYRIDVELTP